MSDSAPPNKVIEEKPRPTLFQILVVQARVIMALYLRETRTRYGSSILGFSWAILEPVFNIAIWALLFHGMGRQPPINVNIAEFIITGILPIMLFRDITTLVGGAITSNRSLLRFPIVHNHDVMLARALLELTNFFVLYFLGVAVFYALDLQYWPAHPMQVLAVVGLIWLYAFGIGSINAVMSCIFHSWAKLVPWYNRLVYLTSGIFFIPAMLPQFAQDILWYFPMAHLVDKMREATFSQYQSGLWDVGFVMGCTLSVLFIGLALERAFRRRISVEQ